MVVYHRVNGSICIIANVAIHCIYRSPNLQSFTILGIRWKIISMSNINRTVIQKTICDEKRVVPAYLPTAQTYFFYANIHRFEFGLITCDRNIAKWKLKR